LKLNYQGNYVKNSTNTKFLGLNIDDSLSWKDHIHQMPSKLNTACFVIRTLQYILSQETLRMVYFAYVHSIMSYGIIFCGNLPYSEKIFKIQKKVIIIIANLRVRDSCRELFKKMEILPLYSHSFTSTMPEGVQQIFIALSWFSSMNLGSNCKHANHYTTKVTL
jgi:hypothetical protein